MPNIAYVNGQFLPLEEAMISIEDRGFQFGDGVYEVIRVYDGTPFQLDNHLSRLNQSAQAISISLPLDSREWGAIIQDGLERCGYAECKVYIQITRGVAPRDHLFPDGSELTVVLTFREMADLPDHMVEQGVAAVTRSDQRWARCSIKSLNLLPNLLAKQEANQVGAFEAILIKDGFVTEGTVSNIVLVRDSVLMTPALSDQLLAGVTRGAVLDLAKEQGFGVEERAIREEELDQADEIFLIGTTIEVLPVSTLNGKPVGKKSPGGITLQLRKKFQEFVYAKEQ